MQLVENGPDIPNDLVEAFFEDKAVFFCGAGVSRNAGLPDFKELTKKAIQELIPDYDLASDHLEKERYDAAFQIIIDEVGADHLNRFLNKELSLNEDTSLYAHEAVLKVAKNQYSKKVRLVTTNFDNSFLLAARKLGMDKEVDIAPRLPPVREDDWWSIVELHGMLHADSCKNLVLTSGQFGLAYMTEGWAARFVAELFRRFIVVFIGYSVEDPVMRYVVDAYRAADPYLAGKTQTYAFLGSSMEEREGEVKNWEAKHIEPIWYLAENHNHDRLFQSLMRLGNLKAKGAEAHKIIINQSCQGNPDFPLISEKSQVHWALDCLEKKRKEFSGEGGPPLGAIGVLTGIAPHGFVSWMRFLHESGVETVSGIVNEKPVHGSAISAKGCYGEHLYAGEWINKLRKKESKDIIQWIAEEGGYLSPIIAGYLLSKLDRDSRDPFERAWILICKTAMNSQHYDTSGHFYITESIFRPGSPSKKAHALVACLHPYIKLRKSYFIDEKKITSLFGLLNPEITLPVDQHVESTVSQLYKSEEWPQILRFAAKDIVNSLDEMGSLLRLLESVAGEIPSDIRYEHNLNESFPPKIHGSEWKIIPSLAFMALNSLWRDNRDETIEVIRHWITTRHSLVHDRVVLRFLGDHFCISGGLFVRILRKKYIELLDDFLCRRYLEIILEKQSKKLSSSQCRDISDILIGWVDGKRGDKGYTVYQEETVRLLRHIYENERTLVLNHSWIREVLARVKEREREKDGLLSRNEVFVNYSPSIDFSNDSVSKIISKLSGDEFAGAEFAQWIEINGYTEALEILKNHEVHYTIVGACLRGIARLIEKSEKEDEKNAIGIMLSSIDLLEDEDLKHIQGTVVYALKTISFKRIPEHRQALISQFDRCMSLHCAEKGGLDDPKDPITDVINSNTYHLTELLLGLLPRVAEPGGQGIPEDIKSRIHELLLYDGRVPVWTILTLTNRLIYLHTLDPEWVEVKIIPYFSHEDMDTRRYAWSGFLWNPRLSESIARLLADIISIGIEVIKDIEFLHQNLGTLPIAMHYFYPQIFPVEKLKTALSDMEHYLLTEAIKNINVFVPENEEKTEEWNAWVLDVLENAMPKQKSKFSGETSIAFVDVIITNRSIAEDIYNIIEPDLVPCDHFDYCLYQLENEKTSFISEYPEISLRLVRKIITEKISPWQSHPLGEFLNRIAEIGPALEKDPDYLFLKDVIRKL